MTDSKQQEGLDVAEKWWEDLKKRRAARARLRRAKTLLEIMQEPEALRLIERLRLSRNPDRVAMLAGILAWVRDNDDQFVARAIGRTSLDEEDAPVSEARFRRLLQARDDERMEAMRRLVRLTKGKVNVRDLSFAVLYWGDGVKKRWIFRYYNVSDSLSASSAT